MTTTACGHSGERGHRQRRLFWAATKPWTVAVHRTQRRLVNAGWRGRVAAIEGIFTERARAVRARRAPAKLTRISVPEYAIDGIRKEVSNGVFEELCGKSTGQLMREALVGAEYIGATDYADILR